MTSYKQYVLTLDTQFQFKAPFISKLWCLVCGPAPTPWCLIGANDYIWEIVQISIDCSGTTQFLVGTRFLRIGWSKQQSVISRIRIEISRKRHIPQNLSMTVSERFSKRLFICKCQKSKKFKESPGNTDIDLTFFRLDLDYFGNLPRPWFQPPPL